MRQFRAPFCPPNPNDATQPHQTNGIGKKNIQPLLYAPFDDCATRHDTRHVDANIFHFRSARFVCHSTQEIETSLLNYFFLLSDAPIAAKCAKTDSNLLKVLPACRGCSS